MPFGSRRNRAGDGPSSWGAGPAPGSPPRSTASRRREQGSGIMQIILHIGLPKTASTFIQAALAANREALAGQGVLYPASLGPRKAVLPLRPMSEPAMAAMRRELSGSFAKAVVSNEVFYNAFDHPAFRPNILGIEDEELPEHLRALLGPHATSWRVLCYFRRPDEHIVSQYQQKVKNGFVGTFDEFFDLRIEDGYYFYARQMDRWSGVFGRSAVQGRVFHRSTLRGNPAEDFAGWIGIEPALLSADGTTRDPANRSFDPISTEILRVLHCCRIEAPELLRRHDLDPSDKRAMKRVQQRLRSFDTGETLRLDPERALRLLERTREDHRRLAELHLPPGHADVLLAAPAEAVPPEPLAPDLLHRRVMDVFEDPELARRAVEQIGRTPPGLWNPRSRAKLAGRRARRNR